MVVDRSGRNAQLIEDGAAQVMNRIHYKIHEGAYFSTGYHAVAVANDGHLYILIKIGPLYCFNLTAAASVEGKCYASLWEDSAIDADGTPMPLYNRKRPAVGEVANTTDATVFHTPTIGSAGLGTALVPDQLIPGGTGVKSVGGTLRSGEEWILARNKNYILDIQNKSGSAADIFIGLGGYRGDHD